MRYTTSYIYYKAPIPHTTQSSRIEPSWERKSSLLSCTQNENKNQMLDLPIQALQFERESVECSKHIHLLSSTYTSVIIYIFRPPLDGSGSTPEKRPKFKRENINFIFQENLSTWFAKLRHNRKCSSLIYANHKFVNIEFHAKQSPKNLLHAKQNGWIESQAL